MTSEDIVAVITTLSALSALLAAAYAGWTQSRVTKLAARLEREGRQEERKAESLRILARFREPLVHSAYDLQSRFYNILVRGLIQKYLVNGDERERLYVIENTAFLIAQYFGWREIIRREVQFLDLGEEDQTRELSVLLDTITHLWLRDDLGKAFRIFAGEQRAVGELMIKEGREGAECIGYSEFLASQDLQGNPVLAQLRADVIGLGNHAGEGTDRLRSIQHALIDLLGFLDPRFIRFPEERRWKA